MSRKALPKQFLNVFGDATLIQNTLARLEGLIPAERCYVVTHERYVDQTADQLPGIPRENILAEPISRNTAPCINYAAVKIREKDPNAVMVVLPADHEIKDVPLFQDVLRAAIEKGEDPGSLVTIGIHPTHPATGYGYIQYGSDGFGGTDTPKAHPVRTFAEKPNLSTAERFLDSGDFLWNSGMFIWRVDSILRCLEQHLPESFDEFEEVAAALGTDGEQRAVQSAFRSCPSISIDYGVMEHAANVYVVPGSFGWSDVGDWRAVFDLSEQDAHGNALTGNVIVQDSSRCLVQGSDRLVVLVGIHDVVVVETPDATLVCNLEAAQKVKTVVEYLHAHQLESYV